MQNSVLTRAKILIIDDEVANVRYLEIILEEAGYYNVRSTTDPRTALAQHLEFHSDIILLDLHMPFLDGFEVMEQLQPYIDVDSFLPILVLTADCTPETKRKALAKGAADFLSKPLDTVEVLLRLNNLLRTRFQNHLLEERVRERTHELEDSQFETLRRLALAAEYRDDDTGLHTRRVGLAAAMTAAALGLPDHQVDLIQQTAPLHDVGKIGIPDAILLKPGRLNEEEFIAMRKHSNIGAGILAGSNSEMLQMAEVIALSHHERWDGRGYPAGLSGEAIPLLGRIVAVADVFDALTHERPYKPAWPVADAIAEITRQSGSQFDPQVVRAFLTLNHEVLL